MPKMPIDKSIISLPDSSIQHFSHHEHRLFLFPAANLFSRCAICSREIQAKRNSYFYSCLSCGYYIHDRCAELPEQRNHSLHPLHPLRLVERSFVASCYYCEKPFSIDDRYVYKCDLCPNFYMHIPCAVIPLPALSSDADDGQIHDGVAQYVCHQHPMALVEHPDGSKGSGAKCFACQTLWSGPAYSCSTEECENFFHKSCAELQKKIQHPLHSRHPLILQVSKPLFCESCFKNGCRLIYSCHEDGCNFKLGIECAFLDTNVPCRSHDHVLFLVEKAFGEIKCDACQKSYESWIDIIPDEISLTRSYLFRCMDCDFNFHFLCGPLPLELKYDYHIHPLTLSDHSVTEDYSEEYFCDACEEKRDPHFRMYCCKYCKYVVHIHCMISKIMKVIKGNRKEVELWALGENRWAIESSMDYQAKRGYPKHGTAEVESKELLLKDIMHSLTEQEKQKLRSPFMSGHRPDVALVMLQIREGMYIDSKKLNALFDREGPSRDTDKLQQLFQFKSSDFSRFIEELQFYRPPGGLKLVDDKFLRQKVENVNGYMVPRTLAPILRTLLHKYPDLGGCDSSLTPAMKSVTSTLLCIVFDRMCKIKVEDITKDDFKYWYFYLQGIRKIASFKIIDSLLDPLEVLARAFLGLEVIRYEKEGIQKLNSRVAELKRRISEFEAELNRCEELCEKHKEYGRSMASDFILKSFSLASELKWKNACDVVLSKIL